MRGSDGKRHLPVLRTSGGDAAAADEEARPAWQWVLLGAVATVLGWLALAMIVNSVVGTRAPEAESSVARFNLVLAAANGLALALSAAGGGYMVGRLSERASV